MKQNKTLCRWFLFPLLLAVMLFLPACDMAEVQLAEQESYSLSDLPEYSGDPYIAINDNQPEFNDSDRTEQAFEDYSDLDSLGRCGVVFANVCKQTMPTEERGSISSVKPTGWIQAEYDCVDGKSLYNRCHLIGFQLTGENANERNLITGTRYLNVEGMLPFENMVADYVKETDNHVLYRVTPIFDGDNLVADGVQIEALSVEDDGDGICFNVYCYNNQPGIAIDYATGESWLEETKEDDGVQATFVLNTKSKKFHKEDCGGARRISDSNRQDYTGSRAILITQGYEPCGQCNP